MRIDENSRGAFKFFKNISQNSNFYPDILLPVNSNKIYQDIGIEIKDYRI